MSELDDPSKSHNRIGWMSQVWRLCFETKFESKKQCVDPESMSVMMLQSGIRSEVSCSIRELGPERVDALSLNSTSAPMVSTQSSVGAESRGLLSDFLTPRQFLHWRSFCWRSSCPWTYLLPWLWRWRTWLWHILWPCVRSWQRCCSKRRLCSSLVSLPSLLSLVKRSEDPFRVPELFKELGLGF